MKMIVVLVLTRQTTLPYEVGVTQTVHDLDFSCDHPLGFGVELAFIDHFHSNAFCKQITVTKLG